MGKIFKTAWKYLPNAVFVALNLSVISVFFVEITWIAIFLCVVNYIWRGLGITAGYHRLFSHNAYQCIRLVRFVLALAGSCAMQGGVLRWAAFHRGHHDHSDEEGDDHSAKIYGFWYSHFGWLVWGKPRRPKKTVRDLEKYWELRLLNRFHIVPGLLLAVFCWVIAGWPGLAWGFFASTFLNYHFAFSVNSVCHLWGRKRHETKDNSRDVPELALFTLGESIHNTHHAYPGRAKHGMYWYDLDPTYWFLWLLAKMGLVWGLYKPLPKK